MFNAVEKAAHELFEAWEQAYVATTEKGEVILSKELEEKITCLLELVKKKKIFLSQAQRRRAATAKKIGRLLGRVRIITPPADELVRKLKYTSLNKLAEQLGINRQTIVNRIKEAEKKNPSKRFLPPGDKAS